MVYTVAGSPGADTVSDAESLTALVTVAVEDLKAVDAVVLDVSTMTEVTDRMMVVTGTSNRHVKAIVGSVLEAAKANGVQVLGTEGRDGNDWVLIDLADVVVHVMRSDARAFYDLERLWESVDAPAHGGSA